MGFRFRKSVKLPGGFRVNVSNSGVGYSWGTKGYRVTKTAKGTTRETITIPGTGISHVRETKTKTSQTPRQSPGKSDPIKQRHGCLTQIVAIPLLLLLIVGIYSGCARSEEEYPGVDRDIPVSTTTQQGSHHESPSPSVSLPLSPSPSMSESEKLDIADIQEEASTYLANQFQMDLIDLKDDSSTYVFTVTVEGFSDREDQTDIPDNWEWFRHRLTTAQYWLAERFDISSDKTGLVLVDSEGEVMLSSLGGDIQENRYKAEKPPQTETPSVRPSPSFSERTVWVSDSGKRYHYDYDCSNMKNPRSISISNAIAQGYTACSKCA